MNPITRWTWVAKAPRRVVSDEKRVANHLHFDLQEPNREQD